MAYEYYDAKTDRFERQKPSPDHSDHFRASEYIFHVRAATLEPIYDDYINNPQKYVRSFPLYINGKKREIVTYNVNEDGMRLRELHRMFAYFMQGCYKSSPNSYAYKKDNNVSACLQKHLKSDTFLKTDIHQYFNSIPFDTLLDKFLSLRPGYRRSHAYWEKAFHAFFYQGHLPIGFISSPVLSDFYLTDFDAIMGQNKSVVYTRYADDIIVSTSGEDSENALKSILEDIKKEMSIRRLGLNFKKTYIRKLKEEGDAIHLLGLNLVRKTDGGNRITVSEKYIRQTSMELCSLLSDKAKLEQWELQERFAQVAGKIGYICTASERSGAKLKQMIKVKTGKEIDLSYNELAQLIMNNGSVIHDYEHQKHLEAYNKKNRICLYPLTGRTWEKVPMSGNPLNFLYSICRVYESGPLNQIKINRLDLKVGEESFSFDSTIDPAYLRSIIKKARQEKKGISYTADYYFDLTGSAMAMNDNRGNNKNCFRPLLTYSWYKGVAYAYSEAENSWLFAKKNQYLHPKYNDALFEKARLDDILEYSEWIGYFDIKLSQPLNPNEETKSRIDSLFADINDLVDYGNKNVTANSNTFHKKTRISMKAQQLYELADKLQEAVMLINQTKGYAEIKGWSIPAGFLETTKETILKYLSFKTFSDRLVISCFKG